MKKALIIGLILALALIIVGGVGTVYAGVSGLNREVVRSELYSSRGGEIIRQFAVPGGMMGEAYGNCQTDDSGETTCTYGRGGMMFGFGPGGKAGDEVYGFGGMMGERGFQQGSGMMGRRAFGYGMMGERGEGPMHEYMISAFAEAIGLSTEDVETRHDNGETLPDIAIAEGIAEDDLPELFLQVREAALGAAVAEGVITQEQANLMLEHMQAFQGRGFGFGSEGCPMWDEQQAP